MLDPVKVSRYLMTGAIYVLAAEFLISAVGKLGSPSDFKHFISPSSWLLALNPTLFLYLVVALEVVVACLLILSTTKRTGAILVFGVLLLFSGMLMLSAQLDADGSCGCFEALIPDT